MKILAIESSCDETAAAVVQDGRKVLSSVIASQVKEHIIYGGVVPEIASRRHTEAICGVVASALKNAKLSKSDIDAVAVTYSPGLIGALLVGVNFAKSFAYSLSKPLIPVHHLRSHIAANYITSPTLEPPFFCLVVSGGHTHMVEVRSYTEFEIVGRTRDDAAGEVMDKTARALGLPYPGGLNLDRESKGGNSTAYSFPRPKVEGSPLDFSFSGLKTAAINTIHNSDQKGESINKKDFGASFIDSVTSYLVDNVENAMHESDLKNIALAGGVSANSVLRAKMQTVCNKNGWQLFLPRLDLCGDNAAMVGSQAYYEFLSGNVASNDLNAYATMPIDEVIV